jgi:ABC-type multidrug transport system fused ATPase/permease subunit
MENTIQSFLLTLGLMVACFMAAYQVVKGDKPVGSFIMLLSYWAQLSGPLQYIATGFGELALDMVDVEEFLDLLQQKPSISDRAGAKPMVLDRGDIEFVDVNFSYDGHREILKNVSFRAAPGQTTALVGQTGGGKSTILKLIPRFYDPVKGVVKIDGQNISDVNLESLRAGIGVVPQDPALFHDTIMNNIRYARLDASDDEIIEACKAVALHERFLSFTDGYNTLVGERGVKLSGGELQRVAIARAIIKRPKIVLLDEATSSVDSETEAQVQESLRMLTAGRTTIVIA